MSMTDTHAFDAGAYKRTTREQWENAAAAWDRWSPLLEDWLGEATELMLDMSGVGPGSRVLDVAAGAGGQTIAAARRVGPEGAVLATDISPAILSYAEERARRAGLANVAVHEVDGEALDVEAGTFDAVISRVGLIYFPEQEKALAGMIAALRPGGRVGAIVYAPAAQNAFFSVPVGIIRRRAELPPPLPGQPGPFSLGADGALAGLFERVGLVDVEVRSVEAPLRVATAVECLAFERESFGALHQMLSALSESEQEAAWAEIGEALAAFEGPEGFVGPCEMLVGVGTKA
jgi:SAM-dependent methyltransferase